MSNEPTITIIGRLGADPEIRFTPNGKPVASVNIATTERRYNHQTGQWEEGDTLWMRGTIWGDMAENASESLRKGNLVIAQGRLKQRSYTTKAGENRTSIEMTIDEIGPSLRFVKAQIIDRGQAMAQAPMGGSQGDPWVTGEAPF